MEFKEFRNVMQNHVEKMFEADSKLFVVDVDKDELWNLYLDSFPPGTNEIFRERREHDCSCCKQFVRNFGNVVILKNNKPINNYMKKFFIKFKECFCDFIGGMLEDEYIDMCIKQELTNKEK